MIFEKISFLDGHIYINLKNGQHKFLSSIQNNHLKILSEDIDYNINIEDNFDPKNPKVVYICIHSSSMCNLRCKYCFMKSRENITDLDINSIKSFINLIISIHPKADKYIVDLSGSGEPLIKIELLEMIAQYCKLKSDLIKREILPMLVSNGTLLSIEMVDKLNKSGILFGVSIDGLRKDHDTYRVDENNKGTYKKIIANSKRIKEKRLLGVAVTITNGKQDLVKIVKSLVSIFPTISMKPVRATKSFSGIDSSNIEMIKKQYTNLADFLLKSVIKGEYLYIAAILNGDDYFGKFLLRTFTNQKIVSRCDAGCGRYSLDYNSDIYVCSAAIGIPKLRIGNLCKGFEQNKKNAITDTLLSRSNSNNCHAKYICGGECLINAINATSTIAKIDTLMCNLKTHLYDLSLKFETLLKLQSLSVLKG